MECLVEYDYSAEESDELSLKKGDRIKEVVTMHDGWWEGNLNGKRGLFPDNFVRVITPNSGSAISDVPKPSEGDAPKMRQKSGSRPHSRRLKAVFSYAPVQEDELRLDVGDVVQFMDEIEEGWYKGELKGRVGVFPSNFVEDLDRDNNVQNGDTVKIEKGIARNRDTFIAKNKVIPDIIPTQSKDDDEIAPKLPPKPVRETARCFYPYFAANDDELNLQEGDIVTIVSKECEDEGWWRGELKGKIGVFPDNFVEIIVPNSPTTSTSPVGGTQPKMTPQERTDDSTKETRSRPGSLATGTVGTSVVDGTGASKGIKTESKVASQIKAFTKNQSPTTKGPAPLSPISPLTSMFGGFSIKTSPKQTLPLSPSSETVTADELNLNSIERNEKLNHLTVSRAKAPKRRPPSTLITREDEQACGLSNGIHGPVSLPMPMQSIKEPETSGSQPLPPAVPPPVARSNSHTIHVPDGTVSLASAPKEPSPGPQPLSHPPGVNKPKTAIPWMAELKLKQDTKKTTGLASPTGPTSMVPLAPNNNVSTVIVAPPAAANIVSSKAPPLPVKPTLPTHTPTTTTLPTDKQPASSQIPVSIPASATVTSTTSTPSPNRFGGVGLKRNSSNPTPPTNHVSQSGPGEYVSVEEYNQMKERVSSLEHKVESLKRQLLELTSDRDFKGLIV